MKRWEVVRLGDPEEALEIVEVDPPIPGEGEVLIKIQAAALNFFDILQCQGKYQEKPDLPFTPGAEASGIIVDANGSKKFREGQKVIVTPHLPKGGYTEYLVANEDYEVFPALDNMPFSDAASLYITYHTAYYALTQCVQIKEGDTLLVHAGSGGVGSAAIQIGKAYGARVIATTGSEEKLNILRQLGADEVINYRETDFVQEVKRLTDGKGADIIFDPVGGDTFDKSRRCVAFFGKILIIGFAGGRIADAPTNHILIKNYSLVGVHFGYFRKLYPEKVEENHKEILQLYEKGLIKPLIYKEYPFTELPQGLNDLGSRKTWGKAVLKVNENN